MDALLQELKKCNYKVSTDTRKDLAGTVYFALRGDSFDGNDFVHEALKKGALTAVTDNPENIKADAKNIYLVPNVLRALQEVAYTYRKSFSIPLIAIGGSNGKSTSKDLLRDVLKTKYHVHSTEGSFNNHIGVPLSLLSMEKDTEIGIFEIGANHLGEHTELLNILQPTHVVVTNNGMDHLEGFGSPLGVREANKEIYDWARAHKREVFVHKKHLDLLEDSKNTARIIYPEEEIRTEAVTPLALTWKNTTTYTTHLFGDYNSENIELALSLGKYFGIETDSALTAISKYVPLSKRSEFVTKNNIHYVVDCYNANPTSMMLSLQSFLATAAHPRGIVLGDMLELGAYSEKEHEKIIDSLIGEKIDSIILIGEHFKKSIEGKTIVHQWFPDSVLAREWFQRQNFSKYTFLLKGSRGIRVEKIME